MLDKLSTQKRLIIATVISVLFFIAYDALFAPKPLIDTNKTVEQNQSAPATNLANSTADKAAIAPKQISKNIATIEGATYSATIDELGRISNFTLKDSKFKNENGEQIQIAISLTCPKNPIPFGEGQGEEKKNLLDIDIGGAFGSIATPPKRVTEITEEEKRNLEALMKRLNL